MLSADNNKPKLKAIKKVNIGAQVYEQMKNQIEMDKKTEIEIDGYKDFVFSNRQNKPFITQTKQKYSIVIIISKNPVKTYNFYIFNKISQKNINTTCVFE